VGPGLGIALCDRFAAAGYNIAMISRDAANLEPFVEQVTKTGATATAYTADVTDQDAVIAAFDAAENDLGPVDIAIHNISGRVVKSILEMEGAEFEAQWRACCLGGLYVGREAAKRMLPREQGSIFFTGGRASRTAAAKFAAFAVAKFGVRALAQSMARELWPQGIHVAHFPVEATIAREPMITNNPELHKKGGMVATTSLAEQFYQTHIQPRDCWTFENDIRTWMDEF
ncbi:MAG: SDR family NAD(P)-dependent oxidoreductase, partial [Proteobacteria bacterium]|nr:SDR family NAD(P)-dependent oxidoreductase [Pseudomonadota bacterium]